MGQGRFITFEGGEGAGKSTQIARLAEALAARGLDVVTTREPGGSPGAEVIRSLLVEGEPDRWDPVTEVLLHYAARRMHVARTVIPALKRGAWVLCDRFADSTLAYQGYGHGVDRPTIDLLHRVAVGKLVPDLTIVLDIPVPVGLQRARKDDENRYERMSTAFHERVRAGFLEIANAAPDRCVVVDASAGIDAVAHEIDRIVGSRLGVPA